MNSPSDKDGGKGLALPLRVIRIGGADSKFQLGWCAIDANDRVIGSCLTEAQANQLVAPFAVSSTRALASHLTDAEIRTGNREWFFYHSQEQGDAFIAGHRAAEQREFFAASATVPKVRVTHSHYSPTTQGERFDLYLGETFLGQFGPEVTPLANAIGKALGQYVTSDDGVKT